MGSLAGCMALVMAENMNERQAAKAPRSEGEYRDELMHGMVRIHART
jgi:hypothetical protein